MKWVRNYFTGRSQYIRAHNKVSTTIPNNCGVLQGAVLSPFFFTLHTSDLSSESLVSFLKYADDVVIGHPCRDAQGLSIINNALKYVSEWSGQYGLNLNLNKCVQCTFSLKENVVTDPDFKAIINDNALSTVDTVTYLGVTFARNAKWTNHVEGIFRKCVRLSFFKKKLRRLSTPAAYIRKFDEACVIPIILFCSPAIFPGLLKQDFALLKRRSPASFKIRVGR